MSTPLPLSARFALWFSAFAAGRASLDEARDRVVEDDTAHDVIGLPDQDGPVPMILALGLLRVEGATAAEADTRRQALLPLDHAARRGLVAACSFPWDG